MTERGFCINIQLNLHAITCPGVWLCPNGAIALQINTFGLTVESRRITPVFPLLFHDKFVLEKVYKRVTTLIELQSKLERQILYAKLIQWITPSSIGVVLAIFEIDLASLLYPNLRFKGFLPGVDVDLLMECTTNFPGIIAPKIRVSTKTIIKEVTQIYDTSNTSLHIVNSKIINSKNIPCVCRKQPAKGIIRQRRVCHKQGRCKTQICQQQGSNTAHDSYLHSSCPNQSLSDGYYCTESTSVPDNPHIFEDCPICLKYKCYFLVCCNEFFEKRNIFDRKCKKIPLQNCTFSKHDHQYKSTFKPFGVPITQEQQPY